MCTMKESLVLTVFLGLCLNAVYTHAWGTYVCDLQEQGLQKIEEVCSESASKFHSPLSALESKLERVLTFVEEIKTAEDSWFHITKRSGMVERDLSQHEETRPTDKHEDKSENDNRRNDEGGNINDRKNEDQPKEDEIENENKEEQDRTRTEDRENDDARDNRRDRTDEYDRQNRRDWAQERDRLDRRDRSRENDRENQRERTEDDDDDRQRDERNDDRRRKEDREESKKGPQKGECVAQVMDSHETIGMFYMMSYQHGHCANRNPIREPIRYCLGYCSTKTFIDRESGMWGQGNDCKSCQATTFETIRIPLSCDDGFTFEKRFSNVVDCTCRGCKPVDNKNNH